MPATLPIRLGVGLSERAESRLASGSLPLLGLDTQSIDCQTVAALSNRSRVARVVFLNALPGGNAAAKKSFRGGRHDYS